MSKVLFHSIILCEVFCSLILQACEVSLSVKQKTVSKKTEIKFCVVLVWEFSSEVNLWVIELKF